MFRSLRILSAVCLVTVASLSARAGDTAEPPKEAAAPTVCPAHEQTLRAITYAHITVKTTLEKISGAATEGMEKVSRLMAENKIVPAGPPVFLLHDMTPDRTAEFTLDLGFIVPPDAKGSGELKVEKLEPYHCMSVLYTGPVAGLSAAYRKFHSALNDAGKTPPGNSRQMFLYFESPDSPNNVVQVSVEIQ